MFNKLIDLMPLDWKVERYKDEILGIVLKEVPYLIKDMRLSSHLNAHLENQTFRVILESNTLRKCGAYPKGRVSIIFDSAKDNIYGMNIPSELKKITNDVHEALKRYKGIGRIYKLSDTKVMVSTE